MVVKDFPEIVQWMFGGGASGTGAVYVFLLLVLAAIVLGMFFGYLVAAFRHGPGEAFYVVSKVAAGSIPDLIYGSPRRIMAIAQLAAKEALRRRVILVAFLIFALSLLFGGWFISGAGNPERVYINFVMWGTQLLILMMVMLISAFSLPEDIKNRTIYTVATKPVRTSEIVVGRILGFAALGTGMLVLMGVISLLFMWRGLSHSHDIARNENGEVEWRKVDPTDTGHRATENAVEETTTTIDSGHRHYVEIIEDIRDKSSPPPVNADAILSQEELDGKIVYRRLNVVDQSGHTHKISYDKATDKYDISSARGFFRARVPFYAAELNFFDRQGTLKTTGISVGDQWDYRGYISGGVTLSRAEYRFEGFTPNRFAANAEKLPLELTLGVYRSATGDMGKRVIVGMQLESIVADGEQGANRFVSELLEFESQEFEVQVKAIPRKLPGQLFGPDGRLLKTGIFDVFDDYAANGNLKMTIRCADRNQYLGMARADIYFRSSDKPYWWNFTKGYLGIWFQMMIVICLGVSFSTFLSAPVVMLASVCTIVFGFFSESIQKLASASLDGGGPLESLVRLITQKNLNSPLPDGLGTEIMLKIDSVFLAMVGAVTSVVPNFARLDFSEFLSYGYFVNNDRLFVAAAISFGFCLGLTVLGYFALKTRELAG